ncbi:hypothetical protein ACFVRD_36835 [Streptomyces sp. NPDC057908]|uniref:hypothetical protein n=1 Tax=Streptomyces sp. NPDC057908 TaxID=3346276 RepID=UPI0036E1BEEE
MTLSAHSTAQAAALWQKLTAHQPGVAAALAMQLRDLPQDWAPRVLGIARPHAALELPATANVPMEIKPYNAADWEDCSACAEVDQSCRFHEGYMTGYDALNVPLTEASRVDPTVTVKDALQRLTDADEAAERGELAAAVAHMTSTENAADTPSQTSRPLNAREFFAVVDLSRPYIPEVDDTEDDDRDKAPAGGTEPHVSADGDTDCDGKTL